MGPGANCAHCRSRSCSHSCQQRRRLGRSEANDAYERCRWPWNVLANGLPKMQAVPAVVHVLRGWRVQLHHAFLFIPKQVLDEAHLFPVRTTPRRRDGDVLPSRADQCCDLQFTAARSLNKKETTRTRPWRAGELPMLHAAGLQPIYNLRSHASSLALLTALKSAHTNASAGASSTLPDAIGQPETIPIRHLCGRIR